VHFHCPRLQLFILAVRQSACWVGPTVFHRVLHTKYEAKGGRHRFAMNKQIAVLQPEMSTFTEYSVKVLFKTSPSTLSTHDMRLDSAIARPNWPFWAVRLHPLHPCQSCILRHVLLGWPGWLGWVSSGTRVFCFFYNVDAVLSPLPAEAFHVIWGCEGVAPRDCDQKIIKRAKIK
jgi:hypothetical protein